MRGGGVDAATLVAAFKRYTTVESRIGPKRGFGFTPGELLTRRKTNPYPKSEKHPWGLSPEYFLGFTRSDAALRTRVESISASRGMRALSRNARLQHRETALQTKVKTRVENISVSRGMRTLARNTRLQHGETALRTKVQTVYNTKGTRAHTNTELIRKWLWEPKGGSLEYI